MRACVCHCRFQCIISHSPNNSSDIKPMGCYTASFLIAIQLSGRSSVPLLQGVVIKLFQVPAHQPRAKGGHPLVSLVSLSFDRIADLVNRHLHYNRDFAYANGVSSWFKTTIGHTKSLAFIISTVIWGRTLVEWLSGVLTHVCEQRTNGAKCQ